MSKKSVPPEGEIYAALEAMAEACPWESVQLDINRMPDGRVTFIGVLLGDSRLGLAFDCCSSRSNLSEVVSQIQKMGESRQPELKVKEKIRELQAQIDKLRAVTIGLPPYKPGLYLGNGEPPPIVPAEPQTIDV